MFGLITPRRWVVLWAGMVSAFAPLASRAEGAAIEPVAVAAHLTDSEGSAKLVFDLSDAVEARARPISDPDRIIVDFSEVNFQIDPALGRINAPKSGALVKAYRFGLFGPGKSRVVIELAHPACLVKTETRLIAKGAKPARLIVELKSCSREAFNEAARASAPPKSAPVAETAAPASTDGPPVIVIDPGHGGVDGGADGVAGAVEKFIVYEFSMELKRKLDASHRFRVVMTRDGDQYVSLEDRVRIAREANAALLISIHADTLNSATEVSGATVYTCSDKASDAQAARIAERENAADRSAGVDARSQDAGVAEILFDLKRRETRAYAHLFSRGLVSRLKAAGRLNHNPERSAGFAVLKAPDFPSVLVELGYLSNAADVASMTSPEWRASATSAMAEAVERFFGPNAPAAPALAASGGKDSTTK